jgi:hypothetical protein
LVLLTFSPLHVLEAAAAASMLGAMAVGGGLALGVSGALAARWEGKENSGGELLEEEPVNPAAADDR